MTDAAQQSERPYGVLARFASAEALVSAARALRVDGVSGVEAYAPYPVEGLAEAVGGTSRGVALSALISGALGGVATYGMQWYSAVLGYPFVVGGEPLGDWPPFVPATAAMVLLFAVIGAWVAMAWSNRLLQPYHPAFNVESFARASSDGFFLLVAHPEGEDKREGEVERRLRDLGAASIESVPP